MKLKFRLSIIVIAIMAVVVAGIAIVLLQTSSSTIRSLNQDIMGHLTNTRMTYWSGMEERRLQMIRTLADIMSDYEEVPPEDRRDEYDTMIAGIFSTNTD